MQQAVHGREYRLLTSLLNEQLNGVVQLYGIKIDDRLVYVECTVICTVTHVSLYNTMKIAWILHTHELTQLRCSPKGEI